jgi:hypothetical protein
MSSATQKQAEHKANSAMAMKVYAVFFNGGIGTADDVASVLELPVAGVKVCINALAATGRIVRLPQSSAYAKA